MSLLTKQQIADILWMSWDHGHFEWKGFKWDLMRWNKKQTAQFEIDWSEAPRGAEEAEEDLKRLEKSCPLRCDFSQAMKDLKREPPMTGREMYQRGYAAGVRFAEKAHGIGIVE